MQNEIVVSICCLTFNHKPYIRETLDSFLMQKANFDFEVLIHDDASTDGTTDIIREYEKKYPDIFKPIYQIENQWSKGLRTISATYNFPRAKGKYIAMCEGDDFWTDPYKLQKQYDFLEENEDFSMCFHSFYKMKGDKLELIKYEGKTVLTIKDLAKSVSGIQTLTVFYRNILKPIVEQSFLNRARITGTYFPFVRLAEFGKLKYMDEPMAVYRVHSGGVWSGISEDQKGIMALQNREAMVIYFEKKPKLYRIFKSAYVKTALNYSIFFLKHFRLSKFFMFLKLSLTFGVTIHHFTYWFEFIWKRIIHRR